MQKESEPSQTKSASEDPVKSIEEDGKGSGGEGTTGEGGPATGTIPDDLWRIMMDIVLTIYEVREEE